MIELTCTKCQTVLSIDDAFAGGVCRCKHCGTIQTVPRQTRRSPLPASVTTNGRPDTVGQATGSGTGLDELAQVVASSGLSGTGLSSSRLRKPAPEGPAPAGTPSIRSEATLILAVGATIVVLLGIIIAILLGRGGEPRSPRPQAISSVPGTRKIDPHFLGVPIHSTSIVYVVDRGSATAEVFDMLRMALHNSLDTLPPTTRFQIVFWETDALITIPAGGMQPATPENVAAAQRALVDVYAFGQSRVEPAIGAALSQKPADIMLATGKAGLDDNFAKAVMGLRRGHPARIHSFSLAGASPEPLRSIAGQTGGEFRELSISELRAFTE